MISTQFFPSYLCLLSTISTKQGALLLLGKHKNFMDMPHLFKKQKDTSVMDITVMHQWGETSRCICHCGTGTALHCTATSQRFPLPGEIHISSCPVPAFQLFHICPCEYNRGTLNPALEKGPDSTFSTFAFQNLINLLSYYKAILLYILIVNDLEVIVE